VAWSRTGAIAYVSEDGQKVLLRHLTRRPDDGTWSLSDESPSNLIVDAHGAHTFIHLCWSDMGADLAVVDSCGRISVFTTSLALNALAQQRSSAIDPDDDGNQPVGLMWLSVNRPVRSCFPASK
jgi:mediator of RNA polymerase II transcription subunit 16